MYLKKLTDPELVAATQSLAAQERAITARLLEHLSEIQSRGLHLQRGHGSLFAFCVEALGFTTAQAHARISAMRLASEVPEVVGKVASGTISLTNVAQAQGFFRQEKAAGNAYSAESKRELLRELEGLSTRQCERKLAELRPEAPPAERERAVAGGMTELRVTVDAELMGMLAQLKAALGHQLREGSHAELIGLLARKELERIGRRRGTHARGTETRETRTRSAEERARNTEAQALSTEAQSRSQEPASAPESGENITNERMARLPPEAEQVSQTAPITAQSGSIEPKNSDETRAPQPSKPLGQRRQHATPAATAAAMTSATVRGASTLTGVSRRSRYIPRPVWRVVWARDGGVCAYVDPVTGRRCGSKHKVQLDHHPIPFALGGAHTTGNLRCACQAHNLFVAEKQLAKQVN
jgi:hypothetical protein